MENFWSLYKDSWHGSTDEVLPGHHVGMIRSNEVALLYHLARDYYQGYGEIVDAGAFIGKSAKSLALGLRDNLQVEEKEKRIHSFDKFTADEDYLSTKIAERFDPGFKFGDSFRHIYDDIVKEEMNLIEVHEGDFLEATWPQTPIEILFIDIAKTLDLHRHTLLEFFPSLIHGRSVLIHQDYHYPFLPYIHVIMEYLNHYFKIIDPKVDDSIVFIYTKNIESEDLKTVVEYKFTYEQQVELLNSAIVRLPKTCRHHAMLARAVLIRDYKGVKAFRKELNELDQVTSAITDDSHWNVYRGKFAEDINAAL
jgi:hypothetical protein